LLLGATTGRAEPPRYFDDAAIHAVQFIDDKEGWAVGDEGVVWHSIDGGKNWERQPTGVRASLRSLYFFPEAPGVGWVVGREESPNGAGSTGVLLFTDNGGWKWRRVLMNSLPALNFIRFLDTKTGYAAGDGSDQFPTGLFVTKDSGHSWQPVPGSRCPSWLTGSFADKGALALGGAWNRLATCRDERLGTADVEALGGRSVRGLHMTAKRGVAVGQGGLVLLSANNSGDSWGFADLKLPHEVRETLDFHAVHGVGNHFWVAGRPGSVLLHSADLGDKWEVVNTGRSAPLNGVFFLDEQHGWAVGELGTILGTTDGGKTWQVQRRGGQRAAVLFIHARSTGMPLDTAAVLGAQEGYLAAALRVTAPDPTTAAPVRASDGLRLDSAWRQAGGAAAEMLWQFPVSSHLCQAERGELIAAWDKLHGDRAAEQMLRQLVLAIRTWRPDVIITDDPDGNADGFTSDPLIAEAVREAFDRAAKPGEFPEQLKDLNLEAWKVSKLYVLTGAKTAAAITLDLNAISGVLEGTAAEFATGPMAVLAGGMPVVPAERRYRLLAEHLPGAVKHAGLMDGLDIAPGGPARRALPKDTEPSEELVKAIRQRATLRAMIETPANQLTDPNRLLANIGPMVEHMPEQQGARAVHAVASHFARSGQWTLARETFLLMVDRYPTDPLSIDAYRWLLRHASSSEARRRHELGQFLIVTDTQFGQRKPGDTTIELPVQDNRSEGPDGPKHTKPKSVSIKVPTFEDRRDQKTIPVADKYEYRKWYEGALQIEPKLAAFGPLLVNDPAVQFCLQAARRKMGDFDTAAKWYAEFAARQPDGPWRDAAASELWLEKRVGTPPKPVTVCRFTDSRPFLDGKLDEDCWQAGQPIKLRNATGITAEEYPTEARIAYDKDYLFLAVRCGHPDGQKVEPVKDRGRNADLRGHDRISLMLDLDRDYSTCYHLQIDQRGCVSDDCWGDKTWDPRWFVKVVDDDKEWVIEAAIPLAMLTGDAVTQGQAWAFNVVRVVPGKGVEAFSLPAEVPEEALRPEGFGLLLFTQDTRQSTVKPMPRATAGH
jgi:photosystem II stability/assembly factor-like uncharacterized protein